MVWGILGVVGVVIFIDLIIHCVAIISILPILERSPPFTVEPVSPTPDAVPIEFRTTDGLMLRGSLGLPPERIPSGVVIFCPELGGDHWSASWYCLGLLEAGFAVLGFDFRNQGQSDRLPGYTALHWLTEYEVADTLAAIEFARQYAPLVGLPIGLFGVSRGGGAALVAAARSPDVRCAACEGAFSISTLSLHYTMRWASLYHPPRFMRIYPVWHVRLTLAMARCVSQMRGAFRYTLLEDWLPRLAGRPVLMIVDGRDTYVLPETSETLFQYFPQPDSQRWLVKLAKHNKAREVDADVFDQRMVQFFQQMVRPSGPTTPPSPASPSGPTTPSASPASS